MLRMAHRIATRNIDIRVESPAKMAIAQQAVAIVKKRISGAMVIVADNVAAYVQEIGVDAKGILPNVDETNKAIRLSDIPNIMPPFNSMLIEWVPTGESDDSDIRQAAIYFVSTDLARADGQPLTPDEPHKMVMAFHFYTNDRDVLVFDGNCSEWKCDGNGRMADGGIRCISGSEFHYTPLAVPFMAIAFMHCKNVIKNDATDELGPKPKWIRQQKAPQIKYHVLNINPMKEVLRTEGRAESDGLKKALHICRGHFAHYPNGLFGKGEACSVYREAHVRGSEKYGIVDKDYSINKPR